MDHPASYQPGLAPSFEIQTRIILRIWRLEFCTREIGCTLQQRSAAGYQGQERSHAERVINLVSDTSSLARNRMMLKDSLVNSLVFIQDMKECRPREEKRPCNVETETQGNEGGV